MGHSVGIFCAVWQCCLATSWQFSTDFQWQYFHVVLSPPTLVPPSKLTCNTRHAQWYSDPLKTPCQPYSCDPPSKTSVPTSQDEILKVFSFPSAGSLIISSWFHQNLFLKTHSRVKFHEVKRKKQKTLKEAEMSKMNPRSPWVGSSGGRRQGAQRGKKMKRNR